MQDKFYSIVYPEDEEDFMMKIKRLSDLEEIQALDGTQIREFLNPEKPEQKSLLGYSLAHATLQPNKTSLPHRFKVASEVYYILKGEGRMYIDSEEADVTVGDAIYIPPKAVQYIKNTGTVPLEFLCLVSPPWTPDAEELV
jgi:mannose-6-phosphate isomerase-like protein (cupin superfamily)